MPLKKIIKKTENAQIKTGVCMCMCEDHKNSCINFEELIFKEKNDNDLIMSIRMKLKHKRTRNNH